MSDLDWEKKTLCVVKLRAFRFDSMTWWQVLTLWSFALNDSPHLQMIFLSISQDSTRRRARIVKSSGSCWNCWIRWMALTKIPLSRHGEFLRFGLYFEQCSIPLLMVGGYIMLCYPMYFLGIIIDVRTGFPQQFARSWVSANLHVIYSK